MQPPQTQYVERDGVSIAYQVVGDGPVDMLIAPGFVSHLDLQWTDPGFSRFLARLASFTRLIMYDKPGTGLSDPIPHLPTLEERVADIRRFWMPRALSGPCSSGNPRAARARCCWPPCDRSESPRWSCTARSGPCCSRTPRAYAPEMVEHREERLDEAREMVEHWGDGARVAKLFAPSD